MFWYRMGGAEAPRRGVRFSHDKLVVRVHSGERTDVAAAARVTDDQALADFVRMPSYGVARAGVMMFQVPHLGDGHHDAVRALRDRARRALRRRDDVRFAGRVLQDADSGEPVLYTENVFVRFAPDTPAREVEHALAEHGLRRKRTFEVAGATAFIVAADGVGTDVFDIASRLLERAGVERAHPELILPLARRGPAATGRAAGGWHLGPASAGPGGYVHAGVRAVWAETKGASVTIAVVDDGVDLEHAAFRGQRSVTGHDVSPPRDGDARASPHGTACAGVAVSSMDDAPGVAPDANLIAVRIDEGLGSYVEADAILAAVAHGADVIVCPWGRPNGYGPVPLPDHVDLALAYATTHGRRGRGCVVVWAAGNGNESMDDDGYASDPRVIAVGSANAMGRRSWYSNYGTRLWCLFPSDDRGLPGIPAPVAGGGVDADFGGTSAAASGVAGVCALVLAVAPELRAAEVAAVLRLSSTPIEVDTTRFDGAGHSEMHGFGLVDAAAAVSLAEAEADTIARLSDAFVDGYVVESIVVVLADGGGARSGVMDAIATLLVERADTRWTIAPVARRENAIDLLPVDGAVIAAADAWSLARTVAALAGVASAEPTLDRVAMRPPRVSRSVTGFCVHDAATDADRLGCDWPLLTVRAREAWALSDGIPGASARGAGVRVAHPDSGYRYHDRFDLARVDKAAAYDIYANKASARDDRDGNHGLATASVLLCGEPGDTSTPFVVGVAPEATLVPFRVVASTLGIVWTVPILVEAGMRRVREAIDRAIEADCHVVSMSLGGVGGETSARLAIQDAVEHGIIVLAAAGNVFPLVVAPAAFPEVIAVAACDVNLDPWRSSASGPEVDVTAPGASVWRAYVDDTDPANRVSAVERSCGTSFAVAITAGAAALWLAHHGRDALIERYGLKGLVPVFRRLLQESAKPAPNLPVGWFGAGVLDAAALLAAPLPPATVTAVAQPVARMTASRAASTPHPSRLLLAPGTADAASERELGMLLDTHPDVAVALDRVAEMPRGRQAQERTREQALYALRGRLRAIGVSREVQRLLP